MELPELGEHCSHQDCKQLDFLPIQCVKCKLTFCRNHIADSKHECTASDDRTLQNEKSILTERKTDVSKFYECCYKDCKQREIILIKCRECDLQSCLKHRFPAAHECYKLKKKEIHTARPKEKIEKMMHPKLTNVPPHCSRVGHKSKKTAKKVNEMKLKLKSAGDSRIPVSERTYFYVHIIPQERTLPMFFSCEFSIGKVLDTIAAYAKLKNENNKKHSRKLRLMSGNNDILKVEMKLKDAVAENIVNIFETISVDYLDVI